MLLDFQFAERLWIFKSSVRNLGLARGGGGGGLSEYQYILHNTDSRYQYTSNSRLDLYAWLVNLAWVNVGFQPF